MTWQEQVRANPQKAKRKAHRLMIDRSVFFVLLLFASAYVGSFDGWWTSPTRCVIWLAMIWQAIIVIGAIVVKQEATKASDEDRSERTEQNG